MPAKIIVLEGQDCSFKETNSKLLYDYLTLKGHSVGLYSFPSYGRQSCYFVEEFLKGAYGKLEEVSPYAASTFYMLDMYDTYKKEIESDYISKDYIIFDRYFGSNIIHQGSRIKEDKRDNFIKRIIKFAYDYLNLPKEDITLYLQPDINFILEKIKNKNSGDLIEANTEQQVRSYAIANDIIEKVGWHKISCSNRFRLYSKTHIFDSIIEKLQEEGIIND